MSTIGVIGATGRTGVEIVLQLLNKDEKVIALVRSEDKAYDVFSSVPRNQRQNLTIKQVDLKSVESLKNEIESCKSVIFAACGTSFMGLFSKIIHFILISFILNLLR